MTSVQAAGQVVEAEHPEFEGRTASMAMSYQAYNAVGAQTVLSIPIALDVLVPALARAVDGDPSTVRPAA